MRMAQPRTPVPSIVSTETAPVLPTAELLLFQEAFLSSLGDPEFDPTVDLTDDGRIGPDDGILLIRMLAPLLGPPSGSLSVDVALAAASQSGASVQTAFTAAFTPDDPDIVRVVGRTEPGALVFTSLGEAIPADSEGFFGYDVALFDPITTVTNTVVDPFGRVKSVKLPIFSLEFHVLFGANDEVLTG